MIRIAAWALDMSDATLTRLVQLGVDCVDGMEDYTCSCMPPWSGRNCEINFKCPEESWDQEKANVRHVCFNGRAVQHYNLPEVRPNALAPADLVEAVRN